MGQCLRCAHQYGSSGKPQWIQCTAHGYGEGVNAAIAQRLEQTSAIRDDIDGLEGGVLNQINNDLERLRLERRSIEMAGIDVPRLADIGTRESELRAEYATSSKQLRALYAKLNQGHLVIETADKLQIRIKVSDVLHTWQPNPMTGLEKSQTVPIKSGRFLSENPREANTEGGVPSDLQSTILMVLLMSVIVTPFGVIAAVYLREYAKQAPLVRIIRVAVNNLAGVPSIVYGVFGLGFFVYFLGGNIDRLFYPEALPAPNLRYARFDVGVFDTGSADRARGNRFDGGRTHPNSAFVA